MTHEENLVRRACTGDSEAFDALVAPHLTQVYRVAFLITRHREMAADAVHEALKQAKRGSRFAFSFAGAVHPATLAETPEGLLQAREERQQLWYAVQKLSPAHRAVIVLRYYAELSESRGPRSPPGTPIPLPPGSRPASR